MSVIRVPYTADPDRRQALLRRAIAKLGRHGVVEGSTEEGTFHGSTPIGSFAGSYRSPAGSDVLEIEVTKKPWLVSMSLLESEARKFLSASPVT